MKNHLRATTGALAFFWLVALAGAIWGGVNNVAEGSVFFSSAKLFVLGAIYGSFIFAIYAGFLAAVVGAFAGPLAVSIHTRRRIAQPSLEKRGDILDHFSDSVLFLVVANMAALIACATYFVPFFIMFRQTGD